MVAKKTFSKNTDFSQFGRNNDNESVNNYIVSLINFFTINSFFSPFVDRQENSRDKEKEYTSHADE